MEREHHGQTAPGEHPASSPVGRLRSAALARLAPTTPAARLPASASPAPGGPDGASSPHHLCFFPSNALSGPAGALSSVMGRAARSQCSNRSGGADHAHPVRDSRSPGDLSRSGHHLTPPPLICEPCASLAEAGFCERLSLSSLLDLLSYLRSFFPFSLSSLPLSSR